MIAVLEMAFFTRKKYPHCTDDLFHCSLPFLFPYLVPSKFKLRCLVLQSKEQKIQKFFPLATSQTILKQIKPIVQTESTSVRGPPTAWASIFFWIPRRNYYHVHFVHKTLSDWLNRDWTDEPDSRLELDVKKRLLHKQHPSSCANALSGQKLYKIVSYPPLHWKLGGERCEGTDCCTAPEVSRARKCMRGT